MDPSIMKFLEEDEDEKMHSVADVEAFTAALNRDIEGDTSSTSQTPTTTNAALSQGTNHTPSHMSQSMKTEKNLVNSQEPNITQNPTIAAQLKRMGNVMNLPFGKQLPFAIMLPVIEQQLDKHKAIQLHCLYVRLRNNNINKEEFFRHMRSLVGDCKLMLAFHKLHKGQVSGKHNNVQKPSPFVPPSSISIHQASESMDNNAQKSRLLEHQSDASSHNMASNINANKQDREQPFPLQGLGKQQQRHMHFPQSPFPNYGNPIHPPNMNMSSQSFKPQSHDLQMRQGPVHQVGIGTQAMNSMSKK